VQVLPAGTRSSLGGADAVDAQLVPRALLHKVSKAAIERHWPKHRVALDVAVAVDGQNYQPVGRLLVVPPFVVKRVTVATLFRAQVLRISIHGEDFAEVTCAAVRLIAEVSGAEAAAEATADGAVPLHGGHGRKLAKGDRPAGTIGEHQCAWDLRAHVLSSRCVQVLVPFAELPAHYPRPMELDVSLNGIDFFHAPAVPCAPWLDRLEPSSGYAGGGMRLTIFGAGFAEVDGVGPTVRFTCEREGTHAWRKDVRAHVIAASQLECRTPPLAAAAAGALAVHVAVSIDGGHHFMSFEDDVLTYHPEPVFGELTPLYGPIDGGAKLTLSGGPFLLNGVSGKVSVKFMRTLNDPAVEDAGASYAEGAVALGFGELTPAGHIEVSCPDLVGLVGDKVGGRAGVSVRQNQSIACNVLISLNDGIDYFTLKQTFVAYKALHVFSMSRVYGFVSGNVPNELQGLFPSRLPFFLKFERVSPFGDSAAAKVAVIVRGTRVLDEAGMPRTLSFTVPQVSLAGAYSISLALDELTQRWIATDFFYVFSVLPVISHVEPILLPTGGGSRRVHIRGQHLLSVQESALKLVMATDEGSLQQLVKGPLGPISQHGRRPTPLDDLLSANVAAVRCVQDILGEVALRIIDPDYQKGQSSLLSKRTTPVTVIPNGLSHTQREALVRSIAELQSGRPSDWVFDCPSFMLGGKLSLQFSLDAGAHYASHPGMEELVTLFLPYELKRLAPTTGTVAQVTSLKVWFELPVHKSMCVRVRFVVVTKQPMRFEDGAGGVSEYCWPETSYDVKGILSDDCTFVSCDTPVIEERCTLRVYVSLNAGHDYGSSHLEMQILDPVVRAIEPSSGPAGGNTSLRILGSGFVYSRNLLVRFSLASDRWQAVVTAQFVSATELQCVTPAAAASGDAAIEVSVNGKEFVRWASGSFRYCPDCTVIAVRPALLMSGPEAHQELLLLVQNIDAKGKLQLRIVHDGGVVLVDAAVDTTFGSAALQRLGGKAERLRKVDGTFWADELALLQSLDERLRKQPQRMLWLRAPLPTLEGFASRVQVSVSMNGKDFVSFDRRGCKIGLFEPPTLLSIRPKVLVARHRACACLRVLSAGIAAHHPCLL
jgi:hypothetical protein